MESMFRGIQQFRLVTTGVILISILATAVLAFRGVNPSVPQSRQRPRAREAGLKVGVLPPGPLNAITDVGGVTVGHTTIVRGDNIRTGVTAILPHQGNQFREKVPAAIFVGNGFGKLMGSTQVSELGEIETPILLTSTLSVPRVADALLDYILALPGNEDVQSLNPVVAETNDGYLNDIRGRHVSREDFLRPSRMRRTDPSRRVRSGPALEPWHLVLRAGLALHHGGCQPASEATP